MWITDQVYYTTWLFVRNSRLSDPAPDLLNHNLHFKRHSMNISQECFLNLATYLSHVENSTGTYALGTTPGYTDFTVRGMGWEQGF